MPTFLLFRGHRSVVQQCCVRLHSTSNNVAPVHAYYMPRIHTNTCKQGMKMASEMENVPESFLFSSKDPTSTLTWNQRFIDNKTKLSICHRMLMSSTCTTAKQVISRRGKSENVCKMYKNENCTCKACKTIVFHCQIFPICDVLVAVVVVFAWAPWSKRSPLTLEKKNDDNAPP